MSASTTVLVIVLVLVVAAAVLSAPAVRSRTRAGRLRRTFGPEYDRLAAQRGDRRAAEQELGELERTHRELRLQPLDEQSRDRYAAAWADAQAGFVDDPAAAERQAERIVGALLTAIGYPAQDADQQLALAAVDHPAGLAEYRRGYDLVHPDAAPTAGSTADDSGADRDEMRNGRLDERAEDRGDATASAAAAAPSSDGVRPAPATAPAMGSADSVPAEAVTETLRQAMLHYRVFFEDLLGRPQQTVAP